VTIDILDDSSRQNDGVSTHDHNQVYR